jgi:hypothetical protein
MTAANGLPESWRITGGNPDAAETAAVVAVLTALLGRAAAPEPEPERPSGPAASGWDRAPAVGHRYTGTWRQR